MSETMPWLLFAVVVGFSCDPFDRERGEAREPIESLFETSSPEDSIPPLAPDDDPRIQSISAKKASSGVSEAPGVPERIEPQEGANGVACEGAARWIERGLGLGLDPDAVAPLEPA